MAQQNVLFSKPLIIDFENFDLWKNSFERYVRGINKKIWDIILKGNFKKPTKFQNNKVVEKPTLEWSDEEEANYCLNYEAKNILFSVLTNDDIERVYLFKTARDIWENLNITYGGSPKERRDETRDQRNEEICLIVDCEKEVCTSYSSYSSCSDNDDNIDMLNVSYQKLFALVNSYKNENAKLKEELLLCQNELNNCKQTIACDNKIKNVLNDKVITLEKKVCENVVCKSCIVLNNKIAYLEKMSRDDIICAKCVILENEIVCFKAKCELHEKNDLLANAFQNSNEKVLKMLNMSNRINCRKGIGSNTCTDKCDCMPIKKVFEKPQFVVTNKTQKPPYVSKMNYVSRKSHAFMYNNKFANPKKSDNPHASFYVYDQYNRKIKMVKKWIPKGMFSVDNPGGMRLWF